MKCFRFIQAVLAPILVMAAFAAQARTVDVVSVEGFPAVAAVEQGITDALANAGLTRLKHFSLNFRMLPEGEADARMMEEEAARKPDVIVAVGIAAARAARAATSGIPIVYVIAGDPAAAGLAAPPDGPGTNVTGVSDAMGAQKRVELIRQIIPGARRVGMVYDPHHEDSAARVDLLRKMLPGDDMTLVSAVAARKADVGAAARSLVDKADVIYTDDDPVVASMYGTLVSLCDMMKIPLIASNIEDVRRGAVAAVGIDYHGLGWQAGKMAARIVRGARVASIAPGSVNAPAVYVNLGAAARQGVTLPDEILKSVHVVAR
jgi:putative ABC transport system substrate-binding protein